MMKDKIKNLTLVALFMALVVIGSRIYIGTHDTIRFHLGNSMCLLAAFILTPMYAGVASGVGSMIFDILFYPSGLGCLVTLLTKFVMGFVASLCFNKFFKAKDGKVALSLVLSGTIGEIAYIILYALKSYIERRFIMSMAVEAVIPIVIAKVGASIVNAIMAIIISTLLYKFVNSFLSKEV